MAVYEFKCPVCGRFDEVTTAGYVPHGPECGGDYDEEEDFRSHKTVTMKRVWKSSFGVSFKGPGFYRNDARKG